MLKWSGSAAALAAHLLNHSGDPPRDALPWLSDIPSVALPDDAGRVRVIAGELDGNRGPARTFTPLDVWDVRLNQGHAAQFSLPEGHTPSRWSCCAARCS